MEDKLNDSETKIIILIMVVYVLMVVLMLIQSIDNIKQHDETIHELKRIEMDIRELKELHIPVSKGTIPNRANNAGCLRNGNPTLDALAIGYINTINGKFLVFDTPQQGMYALQVWIEQNSELPLGRAISKFAPSIENNTSKYIKDVMSALNCDIHTKLSDINTIALIGIIAKIEGFDELN